MSYADQFIDFGTQRWGWLAQTGTVVQRARGGETEGAGKHGPSCQLGHLGNVVGRGRLLGGTSFAHNMEPDRTVGQLSPKVDVMRTCIKEVEVLVELLPFPRETLVQCCARYIFYAFH